MSRNLVLFGMMGVGKSTVAELVAARLGRPVVDTDAEVERAAGRSISAIFDHEGERRFRELEREAVAAAAAETGRVVSVGGGAVLDERSLAALRRTGALVHLDAPADALVERLSAERGGRPLLAGDDLTATLVGLLEARTPRYRACADVTVDAVRPPEAVADDVLAWAAGEDGVLTAEERRRATA